MPTSSTRPAGAAQALTVVLLAAAELTLEAVLLAALLELEAAMELELAAGFELLARELALRCELPAAFVSSAPASLALAVEPLVPAPPPQALSTTRERAAIMGQRCLGCSLT
jgi:hypothetical protein